jgi:hypothetical protein
MRIWLSDAEKAFMTKYLSWRRCGVLWTFGLGGGHKKAAGRADGGEQLGDGAN